MPYIELKKSPNLLNYLESAEEMELFADRVANNEANERIWLLEHPHTYTCGKSYKKHDILTPSTTPLVTTDRGGQVTYHGPGQRVVWLMLRIHDHAPDIRSFVKMLQQWIIYSLEEFQIKANIHPKHIGVWVDGKNGSKDKIAAIGLRIRKRVCRYGFAINVNTDLNYYQNIIPCGINESGLGITSIENLMRINNKQSTTNNPTIIYPLSSSLQDFDDALIRNYKKIFSLSYKTIP